MAPAGSEGPGRSFRKPSRKKHGDKHGQLEYPKQLEPGEDADEDVTAPKGQNGDYMQMKQSVFSMITAAGSKADFHARFNDDSSGSDTEQEPSGGVALMTSPKGALKAQVASPLAESASAAQATPKKEIAERGRRPSKDSRKGLESKLRRSLPKLKARTKRETDYMSQSVILPPRNEGSPAESPRVATPRDAPVMSRMLEARAMLETEEARDLDEKSKPGKVGRPDRSSSLKRRLMEIFGLETPEEVISEYPCWLMQSVLLQGYMYITENHVCFYAYLPKKSAIIVKSGHLSKKGKQNPKFNRYWFTLKGDVLSYYMDPSDLYFPSGNIDLRYGISATLSEPKEKGKETCSFTITTHHRTYHFKADSPASAKEWVRTLQKVIFRSHNDGDSVKISLPIQNIIDIEESPVVDFAETFKLRVFDNDETYAIDEYFFSFFSFGNDAYSVLHAMIDNSSAHRLSSDLLSPNSPHSPGQASPAVGVGSPHGAATPVFKDCVKATLHPPLSPTIGNQSPRMSGEWGRSSIDVGRQSGEASRDRSRAKGSLAARKSLNDQGRRSLSLDTSRKKHNESSTSKLGESSDFLVQSISPSATPSTLNISHNENASASQILNRSDVFHSPTINRFQDPSEKAEEGTHLETGHEKAPSPDDDVSDSPQLKDKPEPKERQRIYDDEARILPQATSASPVGTSFPQYVRESFPVQKAAGLAGYIRRGSKKMGALFATEPMGYVEKVSGMWQGGKRHYGNQHEGPENPDEQPLTNEDTDGHGDRFRAHFALPEAERLRATYFGYLYRVLPLYGKIYIGDRHLCFRSLLPGTRTKLILPLSHIENVTKERAVTALRYAGLVVVIRAFEELFFEFASSEIRDDCCITLLRSLETVKYLQESGAMTQDDTDSAQIAKEEHKRLQEARMAEFADHEIKLPTTVSSASNPGEAPPILFDDPRASIINFKPTESLRITCLTIGSRGDVQPYIALCKGLLAEGHKPKIATHSEFEPWIRKHGIDFAPVEGDPAELMRICVENGMFTYSFLREASAKFRGWIDELLHSSWEACQDTDILIESPSAMSGIHIAEALEIPYFRAFTMPWTRTRAYPHAFAVPERKMGGAYNYMTYVMFDNVFWTAIAGQVNRWRKRELGLRSTNLDKLHPNKVPFLYNFSPSVVIPPLDYSDWIRVTGYWFLDEATDWEPPKELTQFIKKAREDGKKLVYIGFGSIVVSDAAALTKTVVDSVVKADVRCILSKGWSDRLGAKDSTAVEIPLPPEILSIKSAPHDWLFRQIDAAAHHGGSGTTGASLRAGVPTIVKPFFGDQFFFGSRIEDLGVGISMKKLNVSVFSRALWEATHSQRMITKARVLGEQIRKEHGVANAIQAIYRDLEYSKTLIKRKKPNQAQDQDLADEESWTFIGEEDDPELLKRIADWDMKKFSHELKDRSSTPSPSPRTGERRGLGMKLLKQANVVA